MIPLLQVDALSVQRSGTTVLREVSFDVAPGEALAIVGDNGAGKSSLLAGIMGLAATQGLLRFDGHDIAGWPTHRRARLGLGYCPDHRGMFPGLSARETLLATCRRPDRPTVEAALVRFPELQRRADAPSWQLSGGEQQMLALLRAMIAQPKLLLLDEPALGLAPPVRQDLVELLRTATDRGVAIILTEQDEDLALSICTKTISLTNDSKSSPT